MALPKRKILAGSGVGDGELAPKSNDTDRVSYSAGSDGLKLGTRVVVIVAIPEPLRFSLKTRSIRIESVNPNKNGIRIP